RTRGRAIPARSKAACAMGTRGKYLAPKVNPWLVTGGGHALSGHLSPGAQDSPPIGCAAAGDGRGGACHGARPRHGDTPERSEDQDPRVARCAVAKLLVGEGMPARTRRIAGNARLLARRPPAQDRLRGLVEPGQHVVHDLHDLAVDGGVFCERLERLTKLLHLRLVVQPGDGAARAVPGEDALLPGGGVLSSWRHRP